MTAKTPASTGQATRNQRRTDKAVDRVRVSCGVSTVMAAMKVLQVERLEDTNPQARMAQRGSARGRSFSSVLGRIFGRLTGHHHTVFVGVDHCLHAVAE